MTARHAAWGRGGGDTAAGQGPWAGRRCPGPGRCPRARAPPERGPGCAARAPPHPKQAPQHPSPTPGLASRPAPTPGRIHSGPPPRGPATTRPAPTQTPSYPGRSQRPRTYPGRRSPRSARSPAAAAAPARPSAAPWPWPRCRPPRRRVGSVRPAALGPRAGRPPPPPLRHPEQLSPRAGSAFLPPGPAPPPPLSSPPRQPSVCRRGARGARRALAGAARGRPPAARAGGQPPPAPARRPSPRARRPSPRAREPARPRARGPARGGLPAAAAAAAASAHPIPAQRPTCPSERPPATVVGGLREPNNHRPGWDHPSVIWAPTAPGHLLCAQGVSTPGPVGTPGMSVGGRGVCPVLGAGAHTIPALGGDGRQVTRPSECGGCSGWRRAPAVHPAETGQGVGRDAPDKACSESGGQDRDTGREGGDAPRPPHRIVSNSFHFLLKL